MRAPALLARLLETLSACDRLVLLGDVLELRHGPVRDALGAAEETLVQIGAALGDGGEIVIVPGNHDHELAAPWFERRARKQPPPPLGLESAVDWRAGEPLARVARALAPATVRAAYPGVWLREDVFAMHGHYGDRHTTVPMLERLAAGAMARIVREPAAGPRRTEEYEATLAPIYAWIHAIAQGGAPDLRAGSHGASAEAWGRLTGGGRGRSLRRRALVLGFPALIAGVNRARLGPVRADLSGSELRRASLRATAEVIARLRIDARYVIFGHTHRAGPLAIDEPSEWSTPGGGRMLNTGSWVYEPRFLGGRGRESPYWPGFSVSVDEAGVPELRNLLGDLTLPLRA